MGKLFSPIVDTFSISQSPILPFSFLGVKVGRNTAMTDLIASAFKDTINAEKKTAKYVRKPA